MSLNLNTKPQGKISTKEITILSLLTTILFVQEQLLMMIPNVSFTPFLIILYSKILPFKRVSLIVIIYVLIDNLYMGSLNLIYTPPMLIAWLLIPILLKTLFKNINNTLGLALFGCAFGFIYGWIYIPTYIIAGNLPFTIPVITAYLAADILFEIIMAVSNFICIIWFYDPLRNLLEKQFNIYTNKNKD